MNCIKCGKVFPDYQELYKHLSEHNVEDRAKKDHDLAEFFRFTSSPETAVKEYKKKFESLMEAEEDEELRPEIPRWRQELLWDLILKLSSLLDYYDDFDEIFTGTNRKQSHKFFELNKIIMDFIRNGSEIPQGIEEDIP